jgi:cytochrome c oxidase cbb3-type subunit 3
VKNLRSFIAAISMVAIALIPLSARSASDSLETQRKYKAYCAECHGRYGQGNGPTSMILETKPRDFGDCDRMARISDQLMIDVIRNGGYANGLSADMPAWRYALSEADMRDLVILIRRFCSDYAASSRWRVARAAHLP